MWEECEMRRQQHLSPGSALDQAHPSGKARLFFPGLKVLNWEQ